MNTSDMAQAPPFAQVCLGPRLSTPNASLPPPPPREPRPFVLCPGQEAAPIVTGCHEPVNAQAGLGMSESPPGELESVYSAGREAGLRVRRGLFGGEGRKDLWRPGRGNRAVIKATWAAGGCWRISNDMGTTGQGGPS